ncbi:methylglyoxal synthase [Glycocaulis abyssi]|uniref:Methylglyoxal synthase n=2 Tax=Glycocaulis TaxID=1433402 RepID=A0ABQ1XQH3_9PROT|nr:methylglyoxal synthase [Glycocaulis albus]MBV5257383.1 methylglyoxal synthase [Synechococcus moorigangaii CMS01]GGH00492.1 methylglyoxal synthase [Glycocaulis albus]
MITTLGLVAHDACKPVLLDWVGAHRERLSALTLFATGTTGRRLMEAYPALAVNALKSGPLGGDQQLGAMICEGRLDALVFFTDPMSPQPHDVDVKALTRLAVLYDIPLALNRASAEAVIRG